MSYPVLAPVSEGYPKVQGRLLTCYSPVRRSSTPKGLSARLACVKHAASVRPEPGSNSPTKILKSIPATKSCQRNPSRIKPAREKTNWHWLYKHPVEFSKNNRTRSKTALGALVLLYSYFIASSNLGNFPEMRRKKAQVPAKRLREP